MGKGAVMSMGNLSCFGYFLYSVSLFPAAMILMGPHHQTLSTIVSDSLEIVSQSKSFFSLAVLEFIGHSLQK